MNFPWAICLAPEDAGSLLPLRLEKGVEVGVDDSFIWLRGPAGEEEFSLQLRKVPARARYERLADDRLRQVRKRIPAATLPALAWTPLSSWLDANLDAAAFPAIQPASIPLRLERSGEERKPELILMNVDEWEAFTRRSARIRLRDLVFAAAEDGRILVRGLPLPSVPGQRYVVHGRVAVPAGFEWKPAVSLAVLERCLEVRPDEMILWGTDGRITRVHAEQWMPATRPGIWATIQALKHEP